MGLRRGDVVLAVASRDYGKVRPAVVVQSDALLPDHPSVALCPMSSDVRGLDLRPRVKPGPQNGLDRLSEVMVDKITVVPSSRLPPPIGRLSAADMADVDRALALLLGLGEA